MNDFRKARKCLEKIVKHGDLFDALSLKENRKYMDYSFFKIQMFWFSRILYGAVLIGEKVKSFFAPVEEARKAQQEIREILGVSVDIVTSRRKLEAPTIKDVFFPSKKTLSILYENSDISLEDYISDLQKILAFCELHKIPDILLRSTDLDLNVHPFFKHFSCQELRTILGFCMPSIKYENLSSIEKDLQTSFFVLDCEDLHYFIQFLKSLKIDKQMLLDFREKIEDSVVKKAINIYLEKYDLAKLKEMVRQRLSLTMNSDTTFKNRKNEKVIQNVTIRGEYIQVLSMNAFGNILNNQVYSFYDYFEVTNYNGLLKKAEKEDKNLLSMAAFYLYLLNNTKSQVIHSSKPQSFFDQLYDAYQEKQEGKVKKNSGLYPKGYCLYDFFVSLGNTAVITAFCAGCIVLGATIWDGFHYLFLHKRDFDAFTYEKIFEAIAVPYKESLVFEKDLVTSILDELRTDPLLKKKNVIVKSVNEEEQKMEKELFTPILASTGDVFPDENVAKEIIAEITPVKENINLPVYYATNVATWASYQNGDMNYYLDSFRCSFSDLENVETLFEIRYRINKRELENAVFFEDIRELPLLYPLGKNYVVTCITLKDADHPDKILLWNPMRKQAGEALSERECHLLSTMENPEISYGYGILENHENKILNPLIEDEKFYTKASSEEIRAAIIEGLNLENDASSFEIYTAVQNKDYSMTPIKDAHLTTEIQKLDEVEYFKTIASLDSLVCNLAATLAVGADSSLSYTVGYANYDDHTILASEAHAWAMTKEGEIIDITPSEKEESGFSFLSFFFIAMGGAAVLVFKNRIIFYGKRKAVEHMLCDPHFKKTYAKFHKMMYGGINLPCKKSPVVFLESIEQEFHGITKEELKEIKLELEQKKQYNYRMDRFIRKIPFIVENKETLKRSLEKKK